MKSDRVLAIIIGIGTLLTPSLSTAYPRPQQVAVHSATSQLSETQLRQIAQSITVKIVSGNSSGSGVLIDKEGQVYTVLTNRHIIKLGETRIQTADSRTHVAEVVQDENLEGKDLALVQFRSTVDYAIANIANLSSIAVEEPIYVAGFPFDTEIDQLVFNSGKLSLLSERPLKEGYQIGYDNEIEKGMSGGPILNGEGKVIGINGIHADPLWGDPYVYADGGKPTAAMRDLMSRLNWGIPVQTLARLVPRYALLEVLPIEIRSPNRRLPPIAKAVNEVAREITVLIQWEGGNGSGVIIAKQGNTYTVLTADHVVSNKKEFEIITPDGARYPIRVNNKTLRNLSKVDLAVVQFDSDRDYPVAILGNYSLRNKDRYVFVSGWRNLDSGELSRLFTAGSLLSQEWGPVAAQYLNSLTYGYELVYSNVTVVGMSGGPIFDVRGRVIGIHGRADGDNIVDEAGFNRPIHLGYSLGIPVRTFLNQTTEVAIEQEWLKIETSEPLLLTEQQRDLIVKSLLAVEEPKESSYAIDWLNYGNQLWRQFQYTEAVVAFDRATELQPGFYQAWYARGLALIYQNQYSEALESFNRAIESKEKFTPAWRGRSLALAFLKQSEEALVSVDQAISLNYQDDFTLHSLRGMILQDLKLNEEAVAAYSAAIQINLHPWVYNNRGVARNALGQYKGALSDFTKAIELNPEYAGAYNNRGWAYYNLGEYKEAIADYDKAIELDPQDVQAYYNRGVARSALGDNQGAIANYNKAIELNASKYLLSYKQTFYHSALGNLQSVLTVFNQSIVYRETIDFDTYKSRGVARSDLQDYQGALSDFNKAIELNSQDAYAYYNRGNVRRILEDNQGALSDFTKAIELNPDYALAYNDRGVTHSNLENYKDAIVDYTKAIELNPRYASAYYNRAVAHSNLKDYEDAIADYTKAIELDPDYELAYKNRGWASYSLGKFQEAIADYTNAIKINNKDPNNYLYRGIARFSIGEKQNAKADFLKSIEINPDYVLAYVFRGIVSLSLKDYKSAIYDLKKALEKVTEKINPQLASSVYLPLGLVQFIIEDYQGAIANFTKVIELNPDYAELGYVSLGLVRLSIEDYQGAIADYNKVIELNPEHAEAYIIRGLARSKLGEYQRAISDYNQAIELNPKLAIAYNNRGFSRYSLGEYSTALSDYNRALAIDNELWFAVKNIGLVKYEMGEIEKAMQQWQRAIEINGEVAEPQLALAVAHYIKGDIERSLIMAEAALKLNKKWGDLEYLKENLWGEKLLADAQKLLETPKIQALLSQTE